MADILFVPLSDNTTDATVPSSENGPKPWWESSWIAFASLIFFGIAVFCAASLLGAWGTGRINHKGDWLRWANSDARERRRLAAGPPLPSYNEAMNTNAAPRRTWLERLSHVYDPFFAWLDTLSERYDSWRDRRRQEAEARRADAAARRANRRPRGYVEGDPHWPRHSDGRLWDFERDGDYNRYGGVRVCNPGTIWWPQPVLVKWRGRMHDVFERDAIVLRELPRQGLNDGMVLGGLARQDL